ncbi:MAG: ATP-binding protein [Clostridiales bacterium]|nr:ATP-binding protein [Clostridiales bacterium]
MFRKAKSILKEWKNSNKALLVTGARQVGKTYIIREFLKEEFPNDYVEINLLENDIARQIIESSNNAKDLIFRLSAIVQTPIIGKKTVFFLDEVQVCKNIITAIKFLVEDGNFKFILSGSLLGTELADIKSIPVGYMETLNMYPLDFEEFLLANQMPEKVISSVKNNFDTLTPVDEIVHTKLLELFHLYLIVGGMPAVVQKYITTNNLRDVLLEQENINKLYKYDIAKYDKQNKLYINEIYDLIPSELNNQNKRFILKNLNENFKFSRYENSFLWLKDAGVALPCYCADEAKTPLMLSKSRNLFKLFHCDVGLLASMYLDNNLQLKILNKDQDINFGSIYENAIAQELTAKGYNLYYYKNNKLGEIDFLIENKGQVVPIEVKSGKSYKKHQALDNVLGKNKIPISYILSNANLEVNKNKVYLPVYMIMFFEKAPVKDFHYKIDLSQLN